MMTEFRFMSAFRLGLVFFLWAAVSLPGLARSQDADMAGVAAAVRGDVQIASLSDAVGRQVDSGDEIFLGDRVMSGTDSGMQILLLDETVFTVGPDAELVIDDFVYDPITNVGNVAARVVRGAFRFTTGLVGQEDPESVSIGTPLGTIGIRGTIVAGLVGQDQALIVLIGPGDEGATRERVGRIEVSNDQGSVEISRSGYGTVLDLNGGPPSDPVPVPPEAMAQILAAVSGEDQSDDTGGEQPASDDANTEEDEGDEGDAAEEDEGGDEGTDTADEESQSGDETTDGDGAGQNDADTETADEGSDGADGTAAETTDAGAASEDSGSGETESASSNTSGTGTSGSSGSSSSSGSSGTSSTSQSTGSGGSLSRAVSGTSVSSLSGSSIDSAVGGSTSTAVAANTSSSASETTSSADQSSSIEDGVTTVQDLVTVTTGTGVITGNGNLTGTGTTGTFDFTGTANFGNQTLHYELSATWSGAAAGNMSLNAGPESYSQIFQNTNTVDMISGGDEPFKSDTNNNNEFSGLGAGETATVRIRIRNSGGVVAAAIDTQVEIDDNGTIITGEATGTR